MLSTITFKDHIKTGSGELCITFPSTPASGFLWSKDVSDENM
jgi:hypothetical protein